MRALSWGRWSRSIHQGGIHSGRPSGLMRQVQPFCKKCVWWYRHSSRVRLSKSVARRQESNPQCGVGRSSRVNGHIRGNCSRRL